MIIDGKKYLKSAAALIILVFLLGGCSLNFGKKTVIVPNEENNINDPVATSTPEQLLADQSKIKKFENIEELRSFLAENTSSVYRGGITDMAAPAFSESSSGMETQKTGNVTLNSKSAGESDQASLDYSKTNVQVAGVDEADLIKTDGKYIYAVSGKKVFITEAYPAEDAKILSSISFDSWPQNIYLNGDKLIVIGQDNGFINAEVFIKIKRKSTYSYLKVYDISDKSKPKEVRDLSIEGNYSNSRMIGDYVYLFVNNSTYYLDDDLPIPRIFESKVELPVDKSAPRHNSPDIFYFDLPYESYNFASIIAVNAVNNDEKISNQLYLLNQNQNLYVSQNNAFITYTKYLDEFQLRTVAIKELVFSRLSAKDQDRISKIEAADNIVLTPNEKLLKINTIMQRHIQSLSAEEQQQLEKDISNMIKQKYDDISKELEKTVIHKISIDKGKIEYKATGEVTGYVLNQFSMDEQNGYFRIATTKRRAWSYLADEATNESYNNIYVLDENLKPTGALEELAKGEQIYSARFMQNRAYLVTFKQTDPLFVIDLTDPAKPAVLGKLKVPGFSNYLHPYDETTLIGIGKETAESEWGGVTTKGIKISLFDVADVNNPKELAKYEAGDAGSDSIALRDHKAFLFSLEKNLLVIPVTIMENGYGRDYAKMSFSGAAIFKIDKTGIKLRGKIDHSDGGRSGAMENWYGYDYYDNTVKRSLFIKDVLYTYSSKYIKANNLDDLEEISKIDFREAVKNNSAIDYSCSDDIDCAVRMTEDNCCGGRYECVNKSTEGQLKESTELCGHPNSECLGKIIPSACLCLNNKCMAKIPEAVINAPSSNSGVKE